MTTTNKILITGCARSGTSLLLYLMRYFDNTVIVETEINPFKDLTFYSVPDKQLVIKCPQGQQMGGKSQAIGDFKSQTQVKTLQDVIDHGYKIMLLIRDGRDVLVSKHYETKSYWVDSYRWIYAIQNALKLQKMDKSGSILFLRFESFVSDTEANLQKISKFIGQSYSQKYKKYYQDIDQSLDIAKAMNTPRPISADNIGNWKRSEHRNRMQYITRNFGPQIAEKLTQLGYEKNHDWLQQFNS